jgi:transposase
MKRNANVQVYRRAAALLAIDEGRPVSQVATLLGVTRQSIYNWVTTYGHDGDVSDLSDAPRAGRPSLWEESWDVFINEVLPQPPANFGYGAPHWTAALLKQCLAARQSREVSEETLRRQLRRLGYVWKRGRYVARQGARHPNGTAASSESLSPDANAAVAA